MTIDELKQWYVENKLIYFASIELTQQCNFRCKHCYCTDKKEPYLPFEDACSIIDKLFQSGCMLLSFTGGEVFTYPKFKELYLYAKNKGFLVDIVTNGSLLNQRWIDLFTQYPPSNISITIYGANEAEYAAFTGDANNYHLVMHALDLLRQSNLRFYLRTVATNTFYDSLYQMKFEAIAAHVGTMFRYDPIVFPKTTGDRTPLGESLTAKQIVELEQNNPLRSQAWEKLLLESTAFKWKCKAGINSLAIDYKGDAFVCGLYRNDAISLLTNSMETVLKHLTDIHKRFEDIIRTNACAVCQWRKICKWCPAYSRVYNMNETEPIPFFCELAKERNRAFGRDNESSDNRLCW